MKSSLPLLKEMILPSFFTLTKGVKIKSEGISINNEFKNVEIDTASLKKYTHFFDWSTPFPLTFFYLMAQRAQTSLMLQSDFTIAIPGLVHISNRIEKLGIIDYTAPFDLQTNVVVDYKETGSLVPRFTVYFIQNNKRVIQCESIYLARRKGNRKTIQPQPDDAFITRPLFVEPWDIPKDLGQSYASASGDKNPIHSSYLFAKIVGFPSPILQGWYSVSRIVKACETESNTIYTSIEVNFKSPIFLPSKQKVERQKNEKNETQFQVTDLLTNKIVLNGKLR
jgi:acyl dehydratase